MNEKKAAAAALALGCAAGTAAALLIMILYTLVSVKAESFQSSLLIPVNAAALCIGAFAGAAVCAAIRKKKGLIYGTICSGLIFLIFAALSLTVGAAPEIGLLLRLALMLPAGALGGAVGVSLKKKRKRRRK